MNQFNYITALILGLCLSGCSDQPRQTENSNDLTGLWRMKVYLEGQETESIFDFSLIFDDQGTFVEQTSCALPTSQILTRNGNNLLLEGDPSVIEIVDNDHLITTNPGAISYSSKMSVTPIFDMGSLSITASTFPNETVATPLCTIMARGLSEAGLITGESLMIGATYQGSRLDIIVADPAEKLAPQVLDVAQQGLSVTLRSNAFQAQFGTDSIDVVEGMLTITKRSNVWLIGTLESILPDASTMTIDFEVELP